jgi:spermidine/putrescine transport system substrate-binding protein
MVHCVWVNWGMRLCGAAACAAALLAAGCSKPGEADASRQINVYMYSEYIDPAIPAEFEKQTGIKVRLSLYEATEEMMAKLQQAGGAKQYDVVVASDHAVPVLARLGLIRALDLARIPNRANLSERFRDPPYDPGNRYSVPYLWGTVGLMYRKDRASGAGPTWAEAFERDREPGPFVLIDSMRDMLGGALKYQGHSVNSRNPEELRAAGEALLKAKQSPKCLGFEGGVGGKNKVVSGDAALAIVYNGDAVRAMGEDAGVDFGIPREGSLIWVDAMAIPAGAPNAEGAYRFINYLLDAKVGAELANFVRYASPNAAALPLVNAGDRNNPSIYPPEDVMKRLEYLEDLGSDTRLYDEVWTAVKSR